MQSCSQISKIQKDPFRVFFPLGCLLGFIGIVPWMIFALGDPNFFPRNFHIDVMNRGFLICFVYGFLMTAIPKFTETESARTGEIVFGVFLALSSLFVDALGFGRFSSLLTILQIFLIALFIGRRFLSRKNNPPSTFIFVAIGLGMGLLGAFIEFASATGIVASSVTVFKFGNLVGFYGMILALVLGVGSRLYPGILGWVDIVQAQRNQYEYREGYFSLLSREILICLATFILSFIIEVFYAESVGRLIRAALVQYIAIKYWRIHLKPPNASWMSYSLIASSWSIVMGEWLNAFQTNLGIDGKHFVFIGGFALMSLLVGSRVTLAHGEGLEVEKNKWPYLPITFLIVFSAATRVSVKYLPTLYVSHLGYAALIWLIGLGIWGYVFIPKMTRNLLS